MDVVKTLSTFFLFRSVTISAAMATSVETRKSAFQVNMSRPCFFEFSGSSRCKASLAIRHHTNFAATPSVSRAHRGHTNRSVLGPHESQREVALVLALSRRIPDYQQGKIGKIMGLCFAGFGFLTFCGWMDGWMNGWSY